MTEALFRTERRAGGVAWLTLSRPEIHNAFDDRLIVDLTVELERLSADDGVRVVVLTGAGKSFSAGADLDWMRRTATYAEAENLADARALAKLMQTLNELPKPTIARVNGAALGGGTGLVACCDVAIASEHARFGTTEVRLGLIPAVIGPYVVAAVGPRWARRLVVSGERFDARTAARIGLIHEVVPAADLDQAVATVVEEMLQGGPAAIAAAKAFTREVSARPIDAQLIDASARRIAALRATDEAREGITAFLAKRPPGWRG